MTVRYLLDSDWVIHWLNGSAPIGRRVEELRPQGLGLSVVSLAELYEGVYHSADPEPNERKLHDFLAGLALLDIDRETCQIFGRERGRLRAARTLVADFDLLIGATALRHDLTLLSNNRRHFDLIRGLRFESQ